MALSDIFQLLDPDPESQRAEEERRLKVLEQVASIASRPAVGPGAPSDFELLGLIYDLFHDVHRETPFSSDYDALIERLSFTKQRLDESDADLITAWTDFLEESGEDFTWPLNDSMAYWYAVRGMVLHATAI